MALEQAVVLGRYHHMRTGNSRSRGSSGSSDLDLGVVHLIVAPDALVPDHMEATLTIDVKGWQPGLAPPNLRHPAEPLPCQVNAACKIH